MRAGRIGRTAGRAAVIALFGLAVTAVGIVGVHASESDEFNWDSVPNATTPGSDVGAAVTRAAQTASEFNWD